jgi:amidase
MSKQLWEFSASELAQMIRSKEASSEEVVRDHLKRIDEVNPKLNAVTLVLEETALAAARERDKKESSGPLHGVPFTVKENIDLVGSPTTNGVPAGANTLPSEDAPVAERMKGAGAIPIARTNLPELGLRIDTDNPLRGRTYNPWDKSRTAGGSSGGEASAIASGMSPIGLGNDIGGSVRNPAFCCGISSLKPSAGRIPRGSSVSPIERGFADQWMAVDGPMARRVEDLKIAYEVLSGRHLRDPSSVDVPLYGSSIAKKAAIVREVPGIDLPQSALDAIDSAERVLRSAGWETQEAQPPELERVHDIWGHVLSANFKPMVDDPEQFPSMMSHELLAMWEYIFERFDPQKKTILELFTERERLSVLWEKFFIDYPIVIGPVWTDIQFENGVDVKDESSFALTIDLLRFISPANLLGLPSVALTTGESDGLPVGVQFYAAKWRDDLSLDAASIVENELGIICPIDPKF